MSDPRKFAIIVGAPKCGTTSLARALGSRPDMVLGAAKEPRFFTDFSERNWAGPGVTGFRRRLIHDERRYLESFDHKPGADWAIDASTDYLWCEVAAERIARWSERFPTKVICILRDPVERAISEYQHTIRDGLETGGFRASLRAEESRIAAGWQPLFYHVRRSRYLADVERLSSCVKSDLLIVDYHEMKNFPEFLARVERFLGVPSSDRSIPAARENAGYVYRSRWVEAAVRGGTGLELARRIVPPRLRPRLRSVFERAVRTRFRPGPGALADIHERLSDEIAACRDTALVPTANWPSLKTSEQEPAKTAA